MKTKAQHWGNSHAAVTWGTMPVEVKVTGFALSVTHT